MNTRKKRQLSLSESLFLLGLLFLILTILSALLYLSGMAAPVDYMPACLTYRLTGIPCPGCGSTRAFTALFEGDLPASLHYNPAVTYSLLIYIPYMVTNTFAIIRNQALAKKRKAAKETSFSSEANPSFLYPYSGMKIRAAYVYVGLAIAIIYDIYRILFNIPI